MNHMPRKKAYELGRQSKRAGLKLDRLSYFGLTEDSAAGEAWLCGWHDQARDSIEQAEEMRKRTQL